MSFQSSSIVAGGTEFSRRNIVSKLSAHPDHTVLDALGISHVKNGRVRQ